MIELLVIRADDDYFRFRGEGFELCTISKASVFPLSEVSRARTALADVKVAGYMARIMKLTIHEEPFVEAKL